MLRGAGSSVGSLGSGLLGLFLGSLLLLSLGDGGLSGSVSDFRLGVSLGQDGGKVGTDDSSLGLDVLPAPLLGDLLSETLLVHTPVDNGPCDLSGVLSLQEQGLGLGADESEDLGVTPNVKLSLGRVDLLTREVAQFDLHLMNQHVPQCQS